MRLLASGQRDRGHAVRVAAVVDSTVSDHPFLISLADAGVEADVLKIPGRAYLRERALVRNLCRRYCPAIVHTHGFRPDVLDAAVARRMGVPTVTTVHGFTGGGWKVGVYERIQRFAFRWFDAVVAVSRPLADELAASGVPRQRIHTVPNAYAPTGDPAQRAAARRKLGISDDAFTVGWVGRLSHEKGPDVLVDALAHLTDVPTRVSMVGHGPAREALGARAVALGVGERITWHGVVRDAASLFRAFDVFVLSSRTEGSPMVLFEAMAAGVPVVAAEVGGVPDTLSRAE
ncbi:MAG: glycosyltransferase, partial [Gemmatimonadota bacterium]|nr:glycosyltransferase [Gemmatimonadota bacterium]